MSGGRRLEVPEPRPRGVFAGLATLDVIHRVDSQL